MKTLIHETWEINCSDEDLRNIKLRLNGNATRGLTGNNYYDTEFPFIVSGTGSWPESAYDYRESSNANDSKIQPSSESGSVNTSNIIVNPTSISSVNHTTATVSSAYCNNSSPSY